MLPYDEEFEPITVYLHKDTINDLHEIGEECYTSVRDLVVSIIEEQVRSWKNTEQQEDNDY